MSICTTQIIYHTNGNVNTFRFVKNNKWHGKRFIWDTENSLEVEENWINGNLKGLTILNGNIRIIQSYLPVKLYSSIFNSNYDTITLLKGLSESFYRHGEVQELKFYF